MRIVQLVPSLHVGGAERVAALLARALDRAGHTVVVISLADPAGSWIEADLRRAGVEVRFLGKRPGLDLSVIRRLRRALAELRPDVLHTHLHVLKYALPARIGLPGCAIVHTVHNLAEREAESYDRAIGMVVFRRGVTPVAIGDAIAESLRRTYRIEPRWTIPNGIPVNEYARPPSLRSEARGALGLPEGAPVLLAAGRLNAQKNHAGLLDALGDPRLRGVYLLLAGEGELRARLETKARGLGDRVRLLGVQSDVPRLLAACDGFVLPSTWEGNPLVVMEAMAAGRVVVATSVGCVPELLTPETGYLVPPGDTAALADALVVLTSDLPRAHRMGAAGALRARERFDTSTMADAYGRLYRVLAPLTPPDGLGTAEDRTT